MLEEDKIDHIIEIVIQMVQAERIIYDKSEDDYKSKIEKRRKFHVISQAIYQYYEEDWPGIYFCIILLFTSEQNVFHTIIIKCTSSRS